MKEKFQQKFKNFNKAVLSLEEAIIEPIQNKRDEAGIIQNFEMVFELSWKVLKEYLILQGLGANTPKEIFTQAYMAKILDNEKIWLAILKDRNLSVHTYDELLAKALVERIKKDYFKEFQKLASKLQE